MTLPVHRWHPGLALTLALLLAAVHGQAGAQGGFVVYRAATSGGMPVYTLTPPEGGMQPVFSWRTAPPTAPAAPPSPPAARPAAMPRAGDAEIDTLLGAAVSSAQRHGVDLALILAVMEVESAFRARALSPAGAIGPMQLMPGTARRYGVDPWDPKANIDGGTRYLRDLVRMFGGDLRLAVAAYNAGEFNVVKAGYRVPAFDETRRYVPSVLARHDDWSRRIERAARR